MAEKVLEKLVMYRDRQVVINRYDEEESLCGRDGFHFENILVENGRINFNKAGNVLFSLSLAEFPCSRMMSDFSDYYSFFNDKSTVNVYFPH